MPDWCRAVAAASPHSPYGARSGCRWRQGGDDLGPAVGERRDGRVGDGQRHGHGRAALVAAVGVVVHGKGGTHGKVGPGAEVVEDALAVAPAAGGAAVQAVEVAAVEPVLV